ncbi:hypothetical protein Y032_0839g2619 [Ancylostoma ceylanicum]|uniref:Uncharacterized protein n=1 Tax=Ancylostoma ceylanicum TaxID=53326 RepID=A0A016WCG5_9BILA|nr:hypothetical protein Y032_0839g2619 [Ancylostoma ceylanicum]
MRVRWPGIVDVPAVLQLQDKSSGSKTLKSFHVNSSVGAAFKIHTGHHEKRSNRNDMRMTPIEIIIHKQSKQLEQKYP